MMNASIFDRPQQSEFRPTLITWLRYLLEAVFVIALCVGVYFYIQFLSTTPECALTTHHGVGNCPVQLLRWYPNYF
jgi:hypothetical protein